MRIESYREIGSERVKGQIPILFELAFNVPINAQEGDFIASVDTRLRDGPVGYFAIENEQLAGFVGVMAVPTRTLAKRDELCMGIWGVTTSPEHLDRHIFNSLAERVREYLASQNQRFAFFLTSKALVAAALAKRFRCEEIRQFPSAIKLVHGPSLNQPFDSSADFDWDHVKALYDRYIVSKTGFVHAANFSDMVRARQLVDESKSIVLDDGYALIKEHDGVVRVAEMVALNESTFETLIAAVETHATKAVIDRFVMDPRLFNAYEARNYQLQRHSFAVLMGFSAQGESVKDVYGDDFFLTSLDTF